MIKFGPILNHRLQLAFIAQQQCRLILDFDRPDDLVQDHQIVSSFHGFYDHRYEKWDIIEENSKKMLFIFACFVF